MPGGAHSHNVPDKTTPRFADASCVQPGVDPDLFFPTTEQMLLEAQLKCWSCPAVDRCIDAREALPRDSVHGVWHGVLWIAGLPARKVPRKGRPRRDTPRPSDVSSPA